MASAALAAVQRIIGRGLMALGARGRRMPRVLRESRRRVCVRKRRRGPPRVRRVARGACRRKSQVRDRRGCGQKRRRMARVAVRREPREDVVHVALSACNRRVSARERERRRVVVERRRLPRRV